jgi:hypothetical protein
MPVTNAFVNAFVNASSTYQSCIHSYSIPIRPSYRLVACAQHRLEVCCGAQSMPAYASLYQPILDCAESVLKVCWPILVYTKSVLSSNSKF